MPSAHEPRPPERGVLLILSSPSGAGKTTLARRLLDEFDRTEFSVSYTTRPPRKNERDGIDYVFVDSERFQQMIASGELAEWAEVHGNYYGTSRTAVDTALVGGRDVVFDVDWQGARQLVAQWPDDAVRVFVLPPDLETLEARLRGRGTDPEDVIRRRLAKAVDEMTHYQEYQHVIVNDDLERAYDILRAIYLVRRFGEHDRAGVTYPLTDLARLVHDNRTHDTARHAEELIAQGRVRSRS